MNEDIVMVFVKSEYVLGGILPTYGDYSTKRNFIQEPATFFTRMQRIFETDEFGAGTVLEIYYESKLRSSIGWKES